MDLRFSEDKSNSIFRIHSDMQLFRWSFVFLSASPTRTLTFLSRSRDFSFSTFDYPHRWCTMVWLSGQMFSFDSRNTSFVKTNQCRKHEFMTEAVVVQTQRTST